MTKNNLIQCFCNSNEYVWHNIESLLGNQNVIRDICEYDIDTYRQTRGAIAVIVF